MIQFLKNIWYAQRNARQISLWRDVNNSNLSWIVYARSALAEIASANPKNTNGTVRKHVRIARDALGWRNKC